MADGAFELNKAAREDAYSRPLSSIDLADPERVVADPDRAVGEGEREADAALARRRLRLLHGGLHGGPQVLRSEVEEDEARVELRELQQVLGQPVEALQLLGDRKSTRLNSSHIPLSRMPSSA